MRSNIRKIWHDLFYALVSDQTAEFAMRCRNVVAQVDTPEENDSWRLAFRIKLHMSLCQACANYIVFSRFLNQKMALLSKQDFNERDLIDLNQKLLQNYARKN